MFRASNPPAVGFAQLSDLAVTLYGVDSPVPTPTVITPVATVTSSSCPQYPRLEKLTTSLCLAIVVAMTLLLDLI